MIYYFSGFTSDQSVDETPTGKEVKFHESGYSS